MNMNSIGGISAKNQVLITAISGNISGNVSANISSNISANISANIIANSAIKNRTQLALLTLLHNMLVNVIGLPCTNSFQIILLCVFFANLH